MATALFLLAAILFLQPCRASDYGPLMAPLARCKPKEHASWFSFNRTWHALGPFQIGTREPTWGADPLEYIGGFRSISHDPQAAFRSSLPANGTARWSAVEAVQTSSGPSSANASLSISYSNVDWDFLRVVYGWAAVQYQAWARGELVIGGNNMQHVVLYTDAILEFWVDDTHYFGGDFYSFRKAPPVLHLKPGSHTIDVRLVRDVRASGGVLAPTIDVLIEVQQVSAALEAVKPGLLVSDVVNNKLATPIGSTYLRNNGEDDIEIISIQPSSTRVSLSGSQNIPAITIVAGQTRPVAFNITLPIHDALSTAYTITYRAINGTQHYTLQVSQQLNHVSIYRPHKITFLHPGGMASYAMLRPPAENASCHSNQTKLPVLLAFHGAGLEADNPMVSGALDPVSDLCAWILFPTGGTPWSGDDWHNWGFADVEAAIQAIPAWIQNVGWKGPGVDINRWIVSGHSNGGQGTLFALTHRPDKVLAAAPVSGYASIQKYVPYELWQPADPRRTAIISASLNSYRHEMLMVNARGIPIQQQHGEDDDNVPAYNSRLLAQQFYLAGDESSYNEVAKQNHWWDLVMTTPELVDFYFRQARSRDILPRRLEAFSIIVGDPGDMDAKGGIRVTHLKDPGQYGKVDVKGHMITTSNVRSLEFDPALWNDAVTIDRQKLQLTEAITAPGSPIGAYTTNDTWSIGSPQSKTTNPERVGRQLGSMTAILRTQGPFIIRHPGSTQSSQLALQISRNLHQYFQADSVITPPASYVIPVNSTGNVITLAVGSTLDGHQPDFSIRVSNSGVAIIDHQGQEQQYGEEARSAAFVRPLEDERLELVLWGSDNESLRQAARLMPMLTGVGQPDFVVLRESAKWSGIEGALAMGFFDSRWAVSASSVVEDGA